MGNAFHWPGTYRWRATACAKVCTTTSSGSDAPDSLRLSWRAHDPDWRHHTRRNPPIAVWLLILANSLVFVIELAMPPPAREAFFHLFGVVPARFTYPDY